ncbi:MAG: sulfotransferase [Oceanicaulis sp.]
MDAAKPPQRAELQALMQAGRFSEARTALEGVLADDPGDTDALYMASVCERYLGRPRDALALIARLLEIAPDFGRALQEEGHIHRALNDAPRAMASYRAAVNANPGLFASWTGLADILAASGRSSEAGWARARAERARSLPKELQAATHHLYENRLIKAEQICRAWLQRRPRDIEAMRLLAEIGARFGVLDDAEFLLESAVAFQPDDADLRADYVRILRKRQKHEKALEEARTLHRSAPDNVIFISQLAVAEMQAGHYERAVDLFDQVLASAPGDIATLTARGHALKTWGRSGEAVATYKAACRADPAAGDAWYALANLKTYTFSGEELAQMKAQEDAPGQTLQNRINLCFALAKAHDDSGEPDAAFSYYERGNALKKRQTRYTSEQMEAEFEAQKQVCTPGLFADRGGKGHDDPAPIFIVGLPRAGSTLIEQILASHSQVDGTLELPNILAYSQELRGRERSSPRYPAVLAELADEDLKAYGRRFIEETAVHRKGAPFFTDKMPNNFRHIGLIKLILPNAKIIDARRSPLDCCVSGFRQLFAEGQEFTYGLEEIGRYYRGYVDLMDHWDHVLPGEILRVIHEDVIADLEGEVRRLLDFLGLPFEQACVDFHKTERDVRTASSEQVRQPINTKGLEQWRRYEPHLGPLKAALGPALKDWRRDAPRRASTD